MYICMIIHTYVYIVKLRSQLKVAPQSLPIIYIHECICIWIYIQVYKFLFVFNTFKYEYVDWIRARIAYEYKHIFVVPHVVICIK
jgi:hypothetical protein